MNELSIKEHFDNFWSSTNSHNWIVGRLADGSFTPLSYWKRTLEDLNRGKVKRMIS